MKATSTIFIMIIAVTVAGISASAQDDLPTAKVTAKKPALPIAKATETPDKPRINPTSVILSLASGTEIRGALTDTTSVEMKTSFGQLTLPLAEVAGIKLADEKNATTTVIMHNGDSVTGATDIQRLTVETEWGIATVNGSSVSSILLAPGLKWTSDSGLNGVRWELVEASAAQPVKKATASSSQPRASSTASSGRVISGQPVYSDRSGFGQPVIIRSR